MSPPPLVSVPLSTSFGATAETGALSVMSYVRLSVPLGGAAAYVISMVVLVLPVTQKSVDAGLLVGMTVTLVGTDPSECENVNVVVKSSPDAVAERAIDASAALPSMVRDGVLTGAVISDGEAVKSAISSR